MMKELCLCMYHHLPFSLQGGLYLGQSVEGESLWTVLLDQMSPLKGHLSKSLRLWVPVFCLQQEMVWPVQLVMQREWGFWVKKLGNQDSTSPRLGAWPWISLIFSVLSFNIWEVGLRTLKGGFKLQIRNIRKYALYFWSFFGFWCSEVLNFAVFWGENWAWLWFDTWQRVLCERTCQPRLASVLFSWLLALTYCT